MRETQKGLNKAQRNITLEKKYVNNKMCCMRETQRGIAAVPLLIK